LMPGLTSPGRWRRLLRNARLRGAACWAIHCYIRFVYRTNRWTVEGAEAPRRLRAEGRAFIGAFWHGRMLMIPMAWQRMAPMHMLISAHRDGRIIADAVAYFGIAAIAGSSRRGGSAALRAMLKRLKDGDCAAITPDGPRGPAMSASIGIVNAARLAQVPIVPVTYATSRRRVLASWDHFHIALPFGRGVFLWGEPIEIAAELDEAGLEQARSLIEARMVEMVHEADRRVGHEVPPVVANPAMPAPTSSASGVSGPSSREVFAESASAPHPRIGSGAGSLAPRVPPSPRSRGEGWGEGLSADPPVLYDKPR
jgi:lysophospholipid acyltransferase (LPLAT)-like uncharacterized protein